MSRGLPSVLVVLLCVVAPHTHARDITTAEIALRSLSLECLDYQVTGICFFLDCDFTGCTINTSPRISHYLPDVVVSSYQRTGENPWVDMAPLGAASQGLIGSLLGVTGIPLDGGHQHEGRRLQHHANVRFKEVDVIGNPIVSTGELLELLGANLGFDFLCRSEAVAFTPYFQSTLDAIGWRLGVTELIYPASFIPGLREIGSWPFNTWGSVHPRVGFTNTPEDPKAAAVISQRAADIVTRPAQPHVYAFLGGGNCGDGCEPPGPVIENDPENSTWQMLTPMPESTCDVFGVNDTLSPFSWADFKQVDATQDYVWNLWRRYRCCLPQSGEFIGSIEF